MTTRLHSDHMRPNGIRCGTQRGRLVPCARSPHHPHHPELEICDWCEPERETWRPASPRSMGERYYRHTWPDGTPWASLTQAVKERWHRHAEKLWTDCAAYGEIPEWLKDDQD